MRGPAAHCHTGGLVRKKPVIIAATAAAAVVVALVAASVGGFGLSSPMKQATATSSARPTARTTPAATQTPTANQTPAAAYTPLTATALAALPEAMYDAVIPGLLPSTITTIPAAATSSYTLTADAPLFGAGQQTAVARLAKLNFMQLPTIVVPVQTSGTWSLVLTPARQQLPSKDGVAAAQTAGWIPTSFLVKAGTLTQSLTVSVSQQKVSILNADGSVVASFPAGVGAADTPTPTNVVGYLQARYLDPKQNQTVYPIQLASLHSSAADEPYGGNDGGLIGVHYNPVATGDVSHGCVRLAKDAITAVNKLPLGTLINIVP